MIDCPVVVAAARSRFLPAVLALGASACFVGVRDVEDPATGGSGGAAGSGGVTSGGTGGSGGSGAGTGGASNGGTSGSGGAAGSGTGGNTQGGTGGTSNGGSGGTSAKPCGDKVIDPNTEECDDGNDVSGDGCSSDCKVECSEAAGEYLLPNKHCYRGVKDLMSWTSAEAVCVGWHGHLASIFGDDEVTLSHKIANDIGTPAWIGLTDQNAEGTYVWTDGTSFSTPSWEPGEPNDVAHVENCVVLAGNSAGTSYSWYDETCGSGFRSICERAAGVP